MKTLDDSLTDAVTELQAYSGDLWKDDQVQRSIDIGETVQALTVGVGLQRRKLAMLCPYLGELVDTAAGIEAPLGCTVTVSASPDIVMGRPDGHWMAFKKAENMADPSGAQAWVGWRGSFSHIVVGSLQQLVDFYAAAEVPA